MTMQKSIIYTLLIASVMALFISCAHDTDTPDGPNLIDRFGPFDVNENLTVNVDSVNFTNNEKVIMEAEFNKNVGWLIEIIGQESGAVKRIEGFDRSVNAGNATWSGSTTDLPFFRNEMCQIRLTVPEQPEYLDTAFVKVTGPKVYNGSLLIDFETDPGSNIDLGNFEFDFDLDSTGVKNFIPAAQGEFYYSLLGTDITLSNFFVGLMLIKPSIVGETYVPLPTTVPENVYFNCFIYSDGRPHGIAVIEFSYDANDNGRYDEGRDINFKVETDYVLDWVGWKKISHPMSETGMTQEQLEKLVGIRCLLISDANNQPDPPLPVFYAIDYLTFTNGKPLEL